MIYETQIVNGVLCWRHSPRDCRGYADWTEKTAAELTSMLLEAKSRNSEHKQALLDTRASRLVVMSEVMRRAASDGRTLDEQEATRFDEAKSEVSQIDAHLRRMDDLSLAGAQAL